ncbi:hybrid sensor histidine kinase/response regulator [Massilia sp. KIM]|uniref:response regulator n=1 Tax=Massilia sp. KIM TaxID=1955422 RepID=UPI00098F616E|nr:response regulator [Massilia sp. KIM]OON63666.1 hybrid sensor histidine kinase/response regulator [Massilia sp. KIM]
MPNFERSSLNRKLTMISLLSTATALLFVFAAFAVSSVINHRKDEAMQLASFARVIGAASANALLLVDRPQANATLAALEAQRSISSAVLYDRLGQPLARYLAKDRDEHALAPLDGLDAESLADANRKGRALWSRHMRVYHAVRSGELAVGVVMIESDLLPMWLDILASLSVIGLAMAASMPVALILAGRFKRNILEPVTKLIQAAQKVSTSQNYSLRISHKRSDELGTLIDSFNTMMAQIQDRGAALLHHRDELERQVGVRTEQLEKAKNAAEAASRAKSAFLATMSHEIRTPMNGVLGMTEMLLATELTETQRNYTTLVKRSGEHLLVIINDILDFSKIEAGKLTIEYINFNLWDLLDDIHNVYTPQAAAKGIGFDFDIANDIPVAICGDPNRLRQIMANLLGNAIKFTDQGRILARVRMAGEDAQSAMLRFEVHDTGIGISREARARIFNAFSQADDSTTRKYGGTGLGLAISKQLVELMGGAIGVDNAPERGSIFWFTVSFDKRRVDPDAPDAPGRQQHSLEGLRLLVIDENDLTREELVHQLEAWRATCDGAASAAAGYERLLGAARLGRPYDAAVLDMELTQTSGLALAASIRAEPAARHTHLVLLSPERLAADPVQRREAGVAYQLVKPARAADLYACLAMRAARLHGQTIETPARPGAALPAASQPAADGRAPPGRRARRVLLAEDNPVNVEVAKAMLESLGLETHCARNGEEAFNAVREGGWDAVLMDCQMPVMDGFAATSAIRRHEREAGRARTLPVIAITANALQGDREACLAAGMDDYLSKPFTQQQLAAVIARWVALPLSASRHHDDPLPAQPPRPAPLAAFAAAPAPTPPRPPVQAARQDPVDMAALENIRALSREGGDALVNKVVAAYISDSPRQLAALRQAIKGGDADALRRVAHSLKSASANVGASRVAALCRDLEQIGRAGGVDGAAPLFADMERDYLSVRQSLHALLEKET